MKTEEVTPEYIRLFCCDILYVMREYCKLVKSKKDTTRRAIALDLQRQAEPAAAAASAAGGSSAQRLFLRPMDPDDSWAKPSGNDFQAKLAFEKELSVRFPSGMSRGLLSSDVTRAVLSSNRETPAFSKDYEDVPLEGTSAKVPISVTEGAKVETVKLGSSVRLAHFLREYYEWIPMAGLLFLKAPPHTLLVRDPRV